MKCLVLTHEPGRGGTEKAAVSTAVALRRAGNEVWVLFTATTTGVRAKALHDEQIRSLLVTEENREAIVAEIADWNPHLVNIHLLAIDVVVLPHLRAALPAAVFAETNVFSDTKDYARNYDVSLQLSEWCLLNYYLRQPQAKKLPSRIVPYPVDPEGLYWDPVGAKALRTSLGVPESAVVMGRLGQKSEPKWHVWLVDAYLAVQEQCPDTWLVLIGPPPTVEARVAQLPDPIRAKTRILPYVDTLAELRAFYGAVDVFAHIAHIGESFGYVLAEALLCESATVTMSTLDADNTQVHLVRHRETGLVANNLEDFTSHCVRLARSSHLRKQYGAAGRRLVLETCSPELVAREIMNAADPENRRRSIHRPRLERLLPIVVGNLGSRPWDAIRWVLRTAFRLRYRWWTVPVQAFDFADRVRGHVSYTLGRYPRKGLSLLKRWILGVESNEK